jgi:hypothetical protein
MSEQRGRHLSVRACAGRVSSGAARTRSWQHAPCEATWAKPLGCARAHGMGTCGHGWERMHVVHARGHRVSGTYRAHAHGAWPRMARRPGLQRACRATTRAPKPITCTPRAAACAAQVHQLRAQAAQARRSARQVDLAVGRPLSSPSPPPVQPFPMSVMVVSSLRGDNEPEPGAARGANVPRKQLPSPSPRTSPPSPRGIASMVRRTCAGFAWNVRLRKSVNCPAALR